ncbi:MAG TPA: CopG family transcriptional regulator [Thermoanaerobaculia bacterium]|nr:CopG family transcriptional regulator [Thermoanaerobaculia bacterium]
MATVKTAISIDRPLLERIDRLAEELELPRSRVLALAAEEFVQRHERRRVVHAINQACQDDTEAERGLRRRIRRKHLDLVRGEW